MALTYDQSSAVSAQISQVRPARHYGGGAVVALEVVQEGWTSVVNRRLQRLLKLPAGWDGYNARKVSPTAAAFAWNVLQSVMKPGVPAPSIVPVSGGGIQIEWHESGMDVELYVSKPMKAELYVAYADNRDPVERELGADYSELSGALALL